MTDYPQRIGNSLNDRVRLMRLRRKKEDLRFWSELKLIPTWLYGLVFFLYLLAQTIAFYVSREEMRNGNQIFPPEIQDNFGFATLTMFGIVTGVAVVIAFFIFLVAYVNRDASRRGMNAALWTIVVLVFLPSWGLIGFIIYLLMREPLPYPCPQCGTQVGARFNFCPNCKCNLHPTCGQCKNEVAELDKFCPYCGNDLTKQAAIADAPAFPQPNV
jgi:hypothetical protein